MNNSPIKQERDCRKWLGGLLPPVILFLAIGSLWLSFHAAEQARRTNLKGQLAWLSLALSNYQDSHHISVFEQAESTGQSWRVLLHEDLGPEYETSSSDRPAPTTQRLTPDYLVARPRFRFIPGGNNSVSSSWTHFRAVHLNTETKAGALIKKWGIAYFEESPIPWEQPDNLRYEDVLHDLQQSACPYLGTESGKVIPVAQFPQVP